ncbi:MipA/OmpV family protein [Pseudorhodoferax soli]|uniref:Outer membrane scaffolding protein for murein synthesis (MipA/OmpV family) n=1 Tax=Pseudorhodoferax soli TaxID=545864 RepID=A0A368XJP4_9BURK|nr:MipA/OmpV family protein [Pseudorhodoferax soli]RCW68162.1 outer membrane scaffolding protein for murein synthesis (MipA/OmpV family) [Pseudorhodoferax soli]
MHHSTSLSFSLPTPRLRAALAACALAVAGLGSAAAQTAGSGGTDSGSASQWGLGVGLGYERKPYRDFDDKARALPLLMFENRHVSLLGTRADLKLPAYGPVAFSLRARYAFDGYDAGDSPFLAGMAERKDSLWLGGSATWRAGFGTLSAELLGDASGHSKGAQFRLQMERRIQRGDFGFTPRIAGHWMDDKYVDYYYGVQAGEARVGRAFHRGDAAVNVELGVRVDYALAPRQSVFLDVSATRLGDAIQDSPLVDRSGTAGVRVGYLYRF